MSTMPNEKPQKNSSPPEDLIVQHDSSFLVDTRMADLTPDDAGLKAGLDAASITANSQQGGDPGSKDGPITNIKNIVGFLEIVSTAPTATPKSFREQIKLYVNGTTYHIYFYDYKANAWRFI